MSFAQPNPAPIAALAHDRAAVMAELRRLIPRMGEQRKPLPFGLAAIDSHLPDGGLACGALHEVVPAAEGCVAAAFGFIAAVLARLAYPLLFVTPAYGLRPYCRHGRLHGHGLNALGLDPARLILVEAAHRKETLWAMEEAVRSAVPAAVVGLIDTLDLKTSQRLHLAATEAGLPVFLLRPAPTLESSAAATRWRIGTAKAARDRFGLVTQPRWHLQLERCRNGRPGQWVVEYDHVAHRFSLAAALADFSRVRGAGEKSIKQAS
ncbi:MAG TPA: ImuA protein [Xanthobacteraceae bacterium]|nr:ImuA protein [Xanthobacteraceae bacterium]